LEKEKRKDAYTEERSLISMDLEKIQSSNICERDCLHNSFEIVKHEILQ
jgi:hypothetical protein